MRINRDVFKNVDLKLVERPNAPVVLRSGGPIMEMESINEGGCLCSWTDTEGKLNRGVFQLSSLYLCATITVEQVS